jgi:hypothetical protein
VTVQARQRYDAQAKACKREYVTRRIDAYDPQNQILTAQTEQALSQRTAGDYSMNGGFLAADPEFFGFPTAVAAIDAFVKTREDARLKLATFPRSELARLLSYVNREGGGPDFAVFPQEKISAFKKQVAAYVGTLPYSRAFVGTLAPIDADALGGESYLKLSLTGQDGSVTVVSVWDDTADLRKERHTNDIYGIVTVFCSSDNPLPDANGCRAVAIYD